MITHFSRMGRLLHFLSHGAPLTSRGRVPLSISTSPFYNYKSSFLIPLFARKILHHPNCLTRIATPVSLLNSENDDLLTSKYSYFCSLSVIMASLKTFHKAPDLIFFCFVILKKNVSAVSFQQMLLVINMVCWGKPVLILGKKNLEFPVIVVSDVPVQRRIAYFFTI